MRLCIIEKDYHARRTTKVKGFVPRLVLAATSPSQMGNIAFILGGAASQISISQKW